MPPSKQLLQNVHHRDECNKNAADPVALGESNDDVRPPRRPMLTV
jgi:hypothetical protein